VQIHKHVVKKASHFGGSEETAFMFTT